VTKSFQLNLVIKNK